MSFRMFAAKFALSWLFIVSVPAVSYAEHSVGGPGDPLRLVVAEARDDARIILIRVKPDVLEADQTVKDWYGAHYQDLQNVMRSLLMTWTDEVAPTCAFAHTDTQTIVFSYPTCKSALPGEGDGTIGHGLRPDKASAVKLLFHESVHLVGSLDEDVADRVALSIYRTWLTLDLNRGAHWQDLNPDNRPNERTAHASAVIDTSDFKGFFVWGGCNETPAPGQTPSGFPCSTFLGDGGVYNSETDTWEPVPAVPSELLSEPLEGKRAYATAVFAPSSRPHELGQIWVFGGCSGDNLTCSKDFNSILSYDLDHKSWSVIRPFVLPPARSKHVAFWTGSSMFIWGGISDPQAPGRGTSRNDGWIFDGENWTETRSEHAPSPRRFQASVYTGQNNANPSLNGKFIVYGGCDRENGENCVTYLSDSAVFDLNNNQWSPPLPNVSIKARGKSAAVWTGTSMLIWGGRDRSGALPDGALLELGETSESSHWKIISDLNNQPRYGHTMIWTGDRVITWGGMTGYNAYVSGLSEFYLPTSSAPRGEWKSKALTSAPVTRSENSVFWLSGSMTVWGGISEDRSYLQSGGKYFPTVSE